MGFKVVDNPERQRFELRDGRRLIGWTAYQQTAELVVFTHTEIREEWSGQGLGGELVRETLDQLRSHHLPVLPLCSFVSAWIRNHDDYADMLYRAPRSHVAD